MHVLFPAGMIVGVGLPDGLCLFPAHGEGLMVRAAKPQASAQLCQHSMDIGQGAAHPFQACVLDPFTGQRGAYLVISKDGAVLALSGFV